MPFRRLFRERQDVSGELADIPRKSLDLNFLPHRFDLKSVPHRRCHSLGAVFVEAEPLCVPAVVEQQSCWANLPSELLRDILQRVEASATTWPSRKHVVACACVCRNWREIAKDLVKNPQASGNITFPISLKQLGPTEQTIQCFIKRDRTNSTYYLYLGLSSTIAESGKFLMAARRVRRATSSDYIISLNKGDISNGSKTCLGKLRSNFLGTKFTIYDSQPPYIGAVTSKNKAGRRVGFKQISPRVPAASYEVAHVSYELNVLGTRGPRRMLCTLHSIPASILEPSGAASLPTGFPSLSFDDSFYSLSSFGSKSSKSYISHSSISRSGLLKGGVSKEAPLILKNKAPRWHEQLQCWCLNFRGRVTVASVKNFQLVAAPGEPATLSNVHSSSQNGQPSLQNGHSSSQIDHEKVLLQFGKVGKDIFTMDYCYPLSAFHAFTICLSSFDTKLACE